METESRVVVTRGRECLMGQTFSVGRWKGPGGDSGGCTAVNVLSASELCP